MLKSNVLEILNNQLKEEYFSSYLYLAMAAYFEDNNLSGFSNWMKVQAQEEMFHFTKIYDYILERGGRVVLQAIEAPKSEWDSPLAAFKEALAHEQHISECWNKIMAVTRSENDNATLIFSEWFITEQVEEESNADSVVKQMELAKDAPGALFILDRELKTRVFTPPAGA